MAMSMSCVLTEYAGSKLKHCFWKKDAEKVCDDEEDIQGKIVIVTGSNTGVGMATALQLAKRGAVVIMAVRNLEKGKEAMEEIKKEIGDDAKIEVMKVDISDLQSVRDFVKEFQSKYSHLNILVNNAGVLDNSGELKTTKDGFEYHIGTNHLGPFLLTSLLLDSLKKGAPSRIISVQTLNIGFATAEIEDLTGEPKWKEGSMNTANYNTSKLLNAVCMMKLAKTLEGQGIKLFQLDPGLVQTNMLQGVRSNQNIIMQKLSSMGHQVVAISTHEASETPVYLSVAKSVAKMRIQEREKYIDSRIYGPTGTRF